MNFLKHVCILLICLSFLVLVLPVVSADGPPGILTIDNGISSISSNDLVGYWRFDESVGTTVRDGSGYENSGTLENSTHGVPKWKSVNCKFGDCLEFDGEGDKVVIPDSSSISGGPGKDMTIEAWFNMASGTGHGCVVAKFLNVSWKDYGFCASPTSFLFESERNSDEWWWLKEGLALSTDTWYYAAYTFDADTGIVRLYINGEFIDSNDTIPGDFPDTDANLEIGSNAYQDVYFNGTIDEVRIWNRTLAADEIKMLYKSRVSNLEEVGFTFSEPNMGDSDVFYDFYRNGTVDGIWNLDEGAGDYVYDETGNGNYGIVTYDHSLGDTNPPQWASSTECVYGSCLEFDGTNDYVSIPESTTNGDLPSNLTHFTIEAWANRIGGGDADIYELVAGRYAYNSDSGGYALGFEDDILWPFDDRWQFWVRTGSGAFDVTTISSNEDVVSNRWYHLVGIYENGNMKFYVDGESQGQAAATILWPSNDVNFTMGSWRYFSGTYGYFEGRIDGVKLYPRVLSDDEVLCRYGNNCSLYGFWTDTGVLPAGQYYYTGSASGLGGYQRNLLAPLTVAGPAAKIPYITWLEATGDFDQMRIDWEASYDEPSSSEIKVTCVLEDSQSCSSTNPETQMGSCTIDNPAYNMNRDGTELRTVGNKLNCTACNADNPTACSEYVEIFYPLSFEVDVPNTITTIIGQEQIVGIIIKNEGMLSDEYDISVVSETPSWLHIGDGVQSTELLDTGKSDKINIGFSLLSSAETGIARITVNSTTSKGYEEIFLDKTVDVIGTNKSLPDFGLFGIFQIIVFAVILVSFLF